MPRKMKYSGLSWVGEMPDNWTIERGKNIMSILERPVYDDDEVITCFRDGEVTLRSKRRTEGFTISLQETGYQGIEPGDLVVHGMDGFAGAIGISDSRGKGTPVLNVLNSSQNKKYLMYYLRTVALTGVFLALSTGIRVRSCDTNWNKLKNLQYPIPPLEEQKKIADYLDDKCEVIKFTQTKMRNSIEDYKQLKKAIITKAITKGIRSEQLIESGSIWFGNIPSTWEMQKIKFLFHIKKEIAGEEGHTVLSITQKGIVPKDLSKNEGQIAANYSNYQLVNPGDFAMNHMDLLTGWVDISAYSGVTSPDYRVFMLNDTKNNESRYFLYLLQMCYLNRIFYGLGQGVSGMGRWRLQADKFLNFQIPVPPRNVQLEIVEYLDRIIPEIDLLIDRKERAISELENYKKSMIYEYVTGKKEVPQS